MTTSSLSFFMPAFNEEDNIAASIREAVVVLGKLANDFEIIIVDDGSADNTSEIVAALAKKDARIRVIRHKANRGYGAALVTGFKSCRNNLIFFTDADRQFNLSEIKKFLPHVKNYDAVIGYRAPRQDPMLRKINAIGWKWLLRFTLGLKVRDVDCAFKLIKKKQIDKIIIKSRGALVSAELLMKLRHKRCRILELPVSHRPRRAGSPSGARPAVILRAFKELVRYYPELSSLAK